MSLSRLTARAIGLTPTAINTAVPALTTWTVIGMSICNKLSQTVAVDMYITDAATNNTYLMKSFNLPAGETIFPWGQLGKGVLIAGDVIFVDASVAAALDVIMPYYF